MIKGSFYDYPFFIAIPRQTQHIFLIKLTQMIIKFINNVDKNTFELPVNDFGDSRIYFHFKVQLPEGYADGEYGAELWDDEKENCYWTGIVQIGDYKPENKKYIKENNGSKQYSPN